MTGSHCLAPRHCRDRVCHVLLQQHLPWPQQHPPDQLQRKKRSIANSHSDSRCVSSAPASGAVQQLTIHGTIAFVEVWVSVVSNDLFSRYEIVEELKTQLCSWQNPSQTAKRKANTQGSAKPAPCPWNNPLHPWSCLFSSCHQNPIATLVPVTPWTRTAMFCRIIPLEEHLGWKTELLLCCHKPIYLGSAATRPKARAVTRWKRQSIVIASRSNPPHTTADLTAS